MPGHKHASPASFNTLVEALLAAPPDRPFITMWEDEDCVETVTFGEFVRLATLQAAAFHARGLGHGETVILIMPQGIPLMVAFAAAMLLGAVPTILAYPNFKADPDKYTSGLAGVSRNLKARLIAVDDEFPAALLYHLGEDAPIIRYTGHLSGSADFSLPSNRDSPGGLALIQHSAGTTGLQKGVALTHSAVIAQLDHLATAIEISGQDRIYNWLPLYHDMGLIACFMLPLVCHLPIVMQSPLSWVIRPGTMLHLISEYRCTLAWVPNFALQFLSRRVRAEDRENCDLSTLRALINCSEPVRAQSMDEFISAFGSFGMKPSALQTSYAMAENVFAVTQSDVGRTPPRVAVDHKEFSQNNVAVPVAAEGQPGMCFVSSGRCLPGNRVRIVSNEGLELPALQVGEIILQSDSMFEGYYNRRDLSEAVLRDGWYWTGDLGFCVDGDLYVTGRKKDLIIVAGKNIYPQDVEEIVSRHPAIHDGRVVAFGLHNADQGTEDAIIVAELDSVAAVSDPLEIERAIKNAVVSELDLAPRAIYLRPPAWIVKSTAGKPARSATRTKLLAEQPELLKG
jgi:fatty-acyl-CoA synthase